MQETLIWVNITCAAAAILHNARRIRRDNPRSALRVTSMLMAAYVLLVYLLAEFGDISTNLYLRWFMAAIMIYMIVEAQNG